MTDPFKVALNDWKGGEWAEELHDRFDLQSYRTAAASLQNMIALPQGPLVRRPANQYMASTKANGQAVSIPFIFSSTEAYVVELGAGWTRFYTNDGQIESGGSPVEIANPYGADDLPEIHFCQSADILYLWHGDYQTRQLRRSSSTSWTLTTYDQVDGPYLDLNDTATTITPSATSGTVTLTASASLFASTDVGRWVRLLHSGTWGWAKISAFTSATVVTAVTSSNFGGTGATADWRLGAWSDTTGWPRTGIFWRGRLWSAATAAQPSTAWATEAQAFDSYRPSAPDGTVVDSDGISATIDSEQVNSIHWLAGQRRVLMIGTAGGVHELSGDADGVIGPATVQAYPGAPGKAAAARPVRLGPRVLYPSLAGTELLELAYSIYDEAHSNNDLTLFAGHIGRRGIAEVVYQATPWPVVWARLSDGGLAGLTYLPINPTIFAWHQHPLGGVDAVVESLCVIPGATQDRLWMIVKRTMAGGTVRFMERAAVRFIAASATDHVSARFLDAWLEYDGSATTTLSGLDHLEGETVQVLAQGAPHADRTVASGQISLSKSVTKAVVGLGTTARFKTLPLESADGASVGESKIVNRMHIGVHQSLGLTVQVDSYTTEILTFRLPGDPMDAPPPLFSGRIEDVTAEASIESTQTDVTLSSSLPLPLTVTSIIADLEMA